MVANQVAYVVFDYFNIVNEIFLRMNTKKISILIKKIKIFKLYFIVLNYNHRNSKKANMILYNQC